MKKLDRMLSPWKIWKYNVKVVSPINGRSSYNSYSGDVPAWWTSYNKTKHNRTTVTNGKMIFEQANLENVINSLSALFLCNLTLYSELLKKAISSGTYDKFSCALKESNIFISETMNSSHQIKSVINYNPFNGVVTPFEGI